MESRPTRVSRLATAHAMSEDLSPRFFSENPDEFGIHSKHRIPNLNNLKIQNISHFLDFVRYLSMIRMADGNDAAKEADFKI